MYNIIYLNFDFKYIFRKDIIKKKVFKNVLKNMLTDKRGIW